MDGLAVAGVTARPGEFVPPAFVGQRAVGLLLVYPGPEERGAQIAAPFMTYLDPVIAVSMEIPYAGLNSMLDDPPGYRNYWSPRSISSIFPWGGQVAANDHGATPVANRDATWIVHPLGLWEDRADGRTSSAGTRTSGPRGRSAEH